jgi:glycosyltransferase involved in cell wall biosynthesis
MKLLVDGVFFQINNTGIARVWRTILPYLVNRLGFEIYMLDRGNTPKIEGITYIPFPTNLFYFCADDSIIIQKVCNHYEIDVFASTYYTSPLSTPMLLMVYDMIPELFDFDMMQRGWMEKDTAICFAQRYLCISENTRHDLLSFYPEIPPSKTTVAYCGVEDNVFKIRPKEDIAVFRQTYKLDRPYFLFVGSRVQHNGYKNSQIFFDALSLFLLADFDVFCVGGEREIEPEVLARMPAGVKCWRVELTDEELSLAYNGAIALVYPSLYEGFGMPVIEAMASGCPVITTHHGSLLEAAGDAACLVSGTSAKEMHNALQQVREHDYREILKRKGLEHVKRFSWEQMADKFAKDVLALHEEAQQGLYASFFKRWRQLREVQASVDF